MARTYDWEFPLPRTHTGILLGNGTIGAMIWGENNILRITIGRADFWDHRGGMPWTEKQSYSNIRECLEHGDEKRMRELFEKTGGGEGIPSQPTILPVGRIELDLGDGAVLSRGTLNVDDGSALLTVGKGARKFAVRLVMDMENQALGIAFPAGAGPDAVMFVPSWEYVGDYLKKVSFEPPQLFSHGSFSGWIQSRPIDPPLCLGCLREKQNLFMTAVIGDDADKAKSAAGRILSRTAKAGFAALQKKSAQWWKSYWGSAARAEVPNKRLQFLYDYGMYKFAGLTNPDGVAATLQGPWIEEYQMPPWSSDYHFNINVQMCYWPAFHGNRVAHLMPLFKMIEGWLPTLRHNAKVFLGIDDGLMLPHAVDDRCMCMGGFWTGSIDHGCTAWVAQMMYRYYRYTMDRAFLEKTAYPFMVGAMNVYEAMLDRAGREFVLPVTVSPEYRGSAMNAWGRNASFQLACVHRLAEDLLEASSALGKKPRPIWKEIREKLPKATLVEWRGEKRIGLWEGTPLEESHRHHSHLAGIVPFDIFDFEDRPWMRTIEASIWQWIQLGPGWWSGWCVPWAGMIHSRLGNGEAAELWLETWEKVFTNEGHGTLHDVNMAGFSVMGCGATDRRDRKHEVMQMDAGMSCTAAIQEMLLHVRRGVNYLFRGVPVAWKDAGFEHMRTDGGFIVSAARRNRVVAEVEVESLCGGVFALANPWDGKATIRRGAKKAEVSGDKILRIEMGEGERVTVVAG